MGRSGGGGFRLCAALFLGDRARVEEREVLSRLAAGIPLPFVKAGHLLSLKRFLKKEAHVVAAVYVRRESARIGSHRQSLQGSDF